MSILKREVFYDNTGGIARLWDWASVTTTIGQMAEPFQPGSPKAPQSEVEDFDPTDEIARIDNIRAMPRDVAQLVLSGGEHHLHGGVLRPRSGP